MQLTVTMQLNVGNNEAGDWANRTAAVAIPTGTPARLAPGQDEILIRLHGLRGAVEAMRSETHGASIADTRTSRSSVGFGTPAMYRGISFVLPVSD